MLPSSYDLRVVFCSLLIAIFASYVGLELAKRMRGAGTGLAQRWWAGGSIAMGSGIWCMHFVGMLAFSLPIPLGYTLGTTLLSWAAAVAASAVALGIARRERLGGRELCAGALAMGSGIAAMHYLGIAALDVSPGIVWNWPVVAASVAIAIGASAVELEIFFLLRSVRANRALPYQIGAAALIGMAICGMHYTGMAAAGFPVGAVCRGGDGLSTSSVETVVVVSAVALLVFTLLMSQVDARIQLRTSRLKAKLNSANEQLRQSALRDPLTDLPNRLMFEERLAQALERHENGARNGRSSGKVVVLFIDLDGFKPVNDTLGHAVGDLVLAEVAARLRSAVRGSDTVARIGGDQFVILLEYEAAPADPMIAARRIVESVSTTISIGGRPIQVSCSVGISAYPDDGPKDRLVARADTAMLEAKRVGGNTWMCFEERMEGTPSPLFGLQNDLRSAIERRQLELHYQPKVDARTGETHGVEALLRWHHPVHGGVSPATFIPLAERFGLIGKIGNWVIDEACRQVEQWEREGLHMNVAINLSVHQLREHDLVDRIEQALLRRNVDAGQLLCEITESVAMGDVAATQAAFKDLAHIGVLLSIDDFGTGYSSLAYLRRLPARQLKIDRSFVMDLETSSDARAIVSAVVHLAHDLGLGVVAEGVETEGQRDVLVGLGCDELQGYLFAKPMRANDIVGWVMSRSLAAGCEATRLAKESRPQPQSAQATSPAEAEASAPALR